MLKDFFNNIFKQKFYLMFITTVIYILGLISFFQNYAIIIFGIIIISFIFLLIKNYISSKLVIFWVFIFLFAFFNSYFRIKNSDELTLIAPADVKIIGQVITIPDTEKNTRFFLKVNQVIYYNETKNISAKTFVNIEGKHKDINIGDYYKLEGKLRIPHKVSNPSQFDYQKYLRNYSTYTTFYADNIKKIDKTLSLKWQFLQNLNNLRNTILNYHSKNIKTPNIEILGGIVFGDDAVSPPDYIKTSFINSGILHILAASGMNVALIYGIFFFIFNKLRFPYKLNNILGIIIVLIYTLMTGLGPSVIRAAIILEFILIGKLIDRDADSISLLSFVALIMLICNPSYINDVGFQLSFIVTFGLLIMAQTLINKFKKCPSWLSSTIIIPFIAQLWVSPIQMFYFNTFCLYAVLTNILIMPFITIISFGGFISSVLATIKPLATYICFIFDSILNPIISILVNISTFFANLPKSIITMPKPSPIQLFLYYSIILVITLILKKNLCKKKVIILSILCILLSISTIKLQTHSEFIIFDVQNADCMLYKTTKNKYFIIDTGKMGFKGHKNQIKYILEEYLKDNGIKNIEGLILTHFDSDHAGGASDLIQDFNIKNIYVNSKTNTSQIAKNIYKSKVPIIKAKNNETIYSEKSIEIKTFIGNFSDKENENSIITLINDNGYKILLMGDAGIIAFNKIEKDLPKEIDIFKVGHHGAKNVVNEEMINRLQPKYSIISTGINKFGHPNPITLNILSPTNILRTDYNNAIMIKNKKVYCYDSNENKFKVY